MSNISEDLIWWFLFISHITHYFLKHIHQNFMHKEILEYEFRLSPEKKNYLHFLGICGLLEIQFFAYGIWTQ